MKLNKFRTATAVVGAGAVIAMGALTAVLPHTQADAGPVFPQHFCGPVNTSIDNPPAVLGIPTSTSPTGAPLGATATAK